jgi:hypothetical protein
MSGREWRYGSKQARKLCAGCLERKARFRFRGEVRADRDHTLCFECYRAQLNGLLARKMSLSSSLAWNRRPLQGGAPQEARH